MNSREFFLHITGRICDLINWISLQGNRSANVWPTNEKKNENTTSPHLKFPADGCAHKQQNFFLFHIYGYFQLGYTLEHRVHASWHYSTCKTNWRCMRLVSNGPAVRDDEETKESENNNSECVQFGEHFFVVGLSPCLTLTNSCAVVFSQPEASK